MLPETAVPSSSSGFLPDPPLDMAGSRIVFPETAVSLFVSDTRKPVLRLQEGGANVGQKPFSSLVYFNTGAGQREC